jgi:hypothetical protein
MQTKKRSATSEFLHLVSQEETVKIVRDVDKIRVLHIISRSLERNRPTNSFEDDCQRPRKCLFYLMSLSKIEGLQ